MFQKSLVPFTGKQLSKKKKMNVPKAGWARTGRGNTKGEMPGKQDKKLHSLIIREV